MYSITAFLAMRLLLDAVSGETSRRVLPSVSLLVFCGEISAKKQGTRKGYNKGHRGREGAAVNGWRGNAGDTLSVVIISGLPVFMWWRPMCRGVEPRRSWAPL